MSKPNLILGLDLEGMNKELMDKGINLKKDRITEVGAVLWDCSGQMPVRIFSELVNETDRTPIDEHNTKVTGLTEDILNKWGGDPEEIFQKLVPLLKQADYIMAHNGGSALMKGAPNGDYLKDGGYDYPMLKAAFGRYGIPWVESTPWIDSMRDIEFDETIRGRNMPILEYHHGFINPFPHRAVTDVLAMMKIASQYDYERMIDLALSPKVTLIAEFDAPNWRNPREVEAFNKIKSRVSRAKFWFEPNDKIWRKPEVCQLHMEEGKFSEFEFPWKAINSKGQVVHRQMAYVPPEEPAPGASPDEVNPADIPF